jgi:hypothetical protein
MFQQGAPQLVVGVFVFSIAIIFIGINTLLDRKKVDVAKALRENKSSDPDFPVPVIPNSRTEQING